MESKLLVDNLSSFLDSIPTVCAYLLAAQFEKAILNLDSTSFSSLDKIKSPFILFCACEKVFYELSFVGSMSQPSNLRYDIHIMYLQALSDMHLLYKLLSKFIQKGMKHQQPAASKGTADADVLEKLRSSLEAIDILCQLIGVRLVTVSAIRQLADWCIEADSKSVNNGCHTRHGSRPSLSLFGDATGGRFHVNEVIHKLQQAVVETRNSSVLASPPTPATRLLQRVGDDAQALVLLLTLRAGLLNHNYLDSSSLLAQLAGQLRRMQPLGQQPPGQQPQGSKDCSSYLLWLRRSFIWAKQLHGLIFKEILSETRELTAGSLANTIVEPTAHPASTADANALPTAAVSNFLETLAATFGEAYVLMVTPCDIKIDPSTPQWKREGLCPPRELWGQGSIHRTTEQMMCSKTTEVLTHIRRKSKTDLTLTNASAGPKACREHGLSHCGWRHSMFEAVMRAEHESGYSSRSRAGHSDPALREHNSRLKVGEEGSPSLLLPDQASAPPEVAPGNGEHSVSKMSHASSARSAIQTMWGDIEVLLEDSCRAFAKAATRRAYRQQEVREETREDESSDVAAQDSPFYFDDGFISVRAIKNRVSASIRASSQSLHSSTPRSHSDASPVPNLQMSSASGAVGSSQTEIASPTVSSADELWVGVMPLCDSHNHNHSHSHSTSGRTHVPPLYLVCILPCSKHDPSSHRSSVASITHLLADLRRTLRGDDLFLFNPAAFAKTA